MHAPARRVGCGVIAEACTGSAGFRAGVAVVAAMVVCHMLGKPMGWAALGGFETILVDNGGPYRSRLNHDADAAGGWGRGMHRRISLVRGVLGGCSGDGVVLLCGDLCAGVTQPLASTERDRAGDLLCWIGWRTHTLQRRMLGMRCFFVLAWSVGGSVESRAMAAGSVSSSTAGGGGVLCDAGAVYRGSAWSGWDIASAEMRSGRACMPCSGDAVADGGSAYCVRYDRSESDVHEPCGRGA